MHRISIFGDWGAEFCYRFPATAPTCANGIREGPQQRRLKDGGFPNPPPQVLNSITAPTFAKVLARGMVKPSNMYMSNGWPRHCKGVLGLPPQGFSEPPPSTLYYTSSRWLGDCKVSI